MIGVMIIPTGIGCEFGGHDGDANPIAKLLASACDKLIVHPNVVNASDINEMPDNCLYVEGSMLDRFLEGKINLKEVKSNKVLVVVNSPIKPETINAVSASRITLGLTAEIVELQVPLETIPIFNEDGTVSGIVTGWESLVEQVQVKDLEFDALAIATPIQVSKEIELEYYRNGGVNPWGGAEAVISRTISQKLNKPVAHAPVTNNIPPETPIGRLFNEVVDSRVAPERISISYLHSVLKGLHKAPRIATDGGLSVRDIDFMISPANLAGAPHIACRAAGVPMIFVTSNTHCLSNRKATLPKSIIVEHYTEAAGVILAMKKGISLESLYRPIKHTKIS